MHRRAFIRITGGGIVLAATATGISGCSSELPAEALAAWQQARTQTGDLRRWLLGYAILAPHSHNLQSWQVDLAEPDTITLYCDRDRLLPETDPLSRQIMMSQGTFLELLDLAARERGLRADITLFPQGVYEGAQPDARPTARIRLSADAAVRPDPLFGQILRRRTNREAYLPQEPAPAGLQAIAESVAPAATPFMAGVPLRAGFVGAAQPQLIAQHRAIASDAFRIEMRTTRTLMESLRWLRVGPAEIARHRDGLSINAPMVRALVTLGLFDRGKPPAPDDAAIGRQISEFNEKLTATPAFFWLITEGNDRRTQINAGRAWARAQLAATAQGLAMHPLSQALQEYPEVAKPYAKIHALLEAPPPRAKVQMWARLGQAPAVGPSPRRGVQAHLIGA
jgi:hypothetical protein